MAEVQSVASGLERFVPQLASEWDALAPGSSWQALDASLCFVDISGFTSLSERLVRSGRIGAEELTDVLNRAFGAMLELAYVRGGELLKFGGDALLLLFQGEQHPRQACAAAVETADRAAGMPPASRHRSAGSRCACRLVCTRVRYMCSGSEARTSSSW